MHISIYVKPRKSANTLGNWRTARERVSFRGDTQLAGAYARWIADDVEQQLTLLLNED